ncbi:MAG: N-acetyltransferase [Anaerolineaceae bacterium]|nr:N-acetyltransferase [Anaerolineaceae bacterium]
MAFDTDNLDIKNNPDENRFELILDGKTAVVEYMIAGSNIVFTHTEVPPEFSGMGIGNKLAQAALEYAKAEGYKVQALCPFIAAYVRKHPEYQSITWGY